MKVYFIHNRSGRTISIIISDDYKRQIINDYLSNIQTLQSLKDKYKLSLPTISKILNQNNIPIYTKQQLYSDGLKEDIFSVIDSEYKAYFLGLFLADGCVFYSNDGKSPKIIIGLKSEDSYIIELFHSLINANTSLRVDNRGSGYISCVVSSYKMADDLNFYGLDTRKCLRPLPYIRYDLVNHLIRGYFDGDGCFTYRLAHPERKVCNSYSGKAVFLAYEIIREDILRILECIGVRNYRIERTNSEVFLEQINVTRKDDIKLVYDFLYKNATVYLKRKKQKFEQYFQLNHMI